MKSRSKPQPVKARKVTRNEIIWLETEYFCGEDHDHVLLRWDRSSGPVYRTGYWHPGKMKYVGSGDTDFRTQPDYLAVLEPSIPVLVLDGSREGHEAWAHDRIEMLEGALRGLLRACSKQNEFKIEASVPSAMQVGYDALKSK